ncbi:MAG TPA: glucodextranase DOMON-like domain-containing protein [Candidatus Polarisedimenticolaceae bacterium]|nr:glucodextranase DOMON-like domain-containing protein [Candidatus Polarisedimenticolaceae bacterium]
MRRTAALPLLLALLASPTLAGKADVLWTIEDPHGDDRGEGNLLYPLESDMRQGNLDLVSLTAKEEKGGTRFEARFARPIPNPGTRVIDAGGGTLADIARFGFYTTNLDIYVDLDRTPGSGSVNTLPGRRMTVAPDFAWERVICLTPRPSDAASAAKRLIAKTLKKEAREANPRVDQADDRRIEAEVAREVESKIFFPNQVTVSGSTIRFWVPGEVLNGPAKATYAYAIAVSGADIEQRFKMGAAVGLDSLGDEQGLMILPLGPSPSRERFGGGRDGDSTQPQVVDIVVPPGKTQAEVLGNYDARSGTYAVLPGIVPAELAKP